MTDKEKKSLTDLAASIRADAAKIDAIVAASDHPVPPIKPMGKGIVCYGSDDIVKAGKVAADCKFDRARWWYTTNFKAPVDANFSKQAKAWKAATTIKRIVLTCTVGVDSGVIPVITDVKAWAKSVRDTYDGSIDVVQILNEVNLKPKYWAGTIQRAAETCQAVIDVLDGSGIEVIAPSISRDLAKFSELVVTGLKPDAWDFHSYGANAAEHIAGVKGAFLAAKGIPIIESEFGLHSGSYSGWRVEIAKAWEGSKPYITENYCYRLLANAQPAGKFGLVMADTWADNPETYLTWRGLQ